MPSSVERKLAAIMFTDIAGFTALSGKDETKALSLLDKQKEVIIPIMDEFNGTLHKEMGDGLLFTFPTVTEAVKCAIKIQEVAKKYNLPAGYHQNLQQPAQSYPDQSCVFQFAVLHHKRPVSCLHID